MRVKRRIEPIAPVVTDTAKTSAMTHQARMRALMLSTMARCASPPTRRLNSRADDRRDDEQHQDAAKQTEQRRCRPGDSLASLSVGSTPSALSQGIRACPRRCLVASGGRTTTRLSIGTGRIFALREDPVQVVEIDRNQLDIRPQPREVVQSALEAADLAVETARSFGKHDQANTGLPLHPPCAGSTRARRRRHRSSRPAPAESARHGTPCPARYRRTDALFPVVASRDRPRQQRAVSRQRRPDDDEIEVARVIAEVNPLTLATRIAVPVHRRAADEARRRIASAVAIIALPPRSRCAACAGRGSRSIPRRSAARPTRMARGGMPSIVSTCREQRRDA